MACSSRNGGVIQGWQSALCDNDLLKVHMLNAAVKMSIERGRGKLVKLNASSHIDGLCAMADAFCVRQHDWDQYGERLQN